jgi:hypothetical protein
MLSLLELQKLLSYNEALLQKETSKQNCTDMKRLLELQYHRSVIKDCIIEILSQELANQNNTKKVA